MQKFFLAFTISLLTIQTLCAQEIRQTVKGQIFDIETGLPLPGATVIVNGLDPLVGTTSDANGNFRFEALSIGRYDFIFSFIGYEPYVAGEVVVGSAKEVSLNIGIK